MSPLGMKLNARERAARKTPHTLAALDLGSSKISCFIAHRDPSLPKGYTLLGAGHQSSQGIKNGSVVDMERLEQAIRLAVEDAEREAGIEVSDIYLGVSGPDMDCLRIQASIPLAHHEISVREVRGVIAASIVEQADKDMAILHTSPIDYAVDGHWGILDPRGMLGQNLGVHVNIVRVKSAPLRNMVQCVARAHLKVLGFVATPIASALSVLVEDELKNGAICVDMGGGLTKYAIFQGGTPIYLGSIPIGGNHVTSDIAQGFGTTFAIAERIKTLYGNALDNEKDDFDLFEMQCLGDNGHLQPYEFKKQHLSAIVRPRLEETFEYLRANIREARIYTDIPHRVVLTGGASQIGGVRDLATNILGMPVRMAKPNLDNNLSETYSNPIFAASQGILEWPLKGSAYSVQRMPEKTMHSLADYLKASWRWLKENF